MTPTHRMSFHLDSDGDLVGQISRISDSYAHDRYYISSGRVRELWNYFKDDHFDQKPFTTLFHEGEFIAVAQEVWNSRKTGVSRNSDPVHYSPGQVVVGDQTMTVAEFTRQLALTAHPVHQEVTISDFTF